MIAQILQSGGCVTREPLDRPQSDAHFRTRVGFRQIIKKVALLNGPLFVFAAEFQVHIREVDLLAKSCGPERRLLDVAEGRWSIERSPG